MEKVVKRGWVGGALVGLALVLATVSGGAATNPNNSSMASLRQAIANPDHTVEWAVSGTVSAASIANH